MARVKITIDFEADLDIVPGWGHLPEDWVALVKKRLTEETSYKPTVEIKAVEVEGFNCTRTTLDVLEDKIARGPGWGPFAVREPNQV